MNNSLVGPLHGEAKAASAGVPGLNYKLVVLVYNATLEAVGGTAVYLCSDAGACTTGEVLRVDGGFHVLGMPQQDNL